MYVPAHMCIFFCMPPPSFPFPLFPGHCFRPQIHRKDVASATHGEIAGFRVQNATEDMFEKGAVASLVSDESRPRSLKSFTASVVILDHPGSIKVGYTPVVDCHAVHSACRISRIVKKVDRLTGNRSP